VQDEREGEGPKSVPEPWESKEAEMVEAFSLHWTNLVEEGELGSNGRVLEYKVRMPSTRIMRQETNLTIVSIDVPEQNGRGKRRRRLED
jgi:hypothetical protein